MQVANAIKKLAKAGFEVNQNGNCFSAQGLKRLIEFYEQEGIVIGLRVRSVVDRDDWVGGYSAGVFCDNLSQAIRLAN